MEANYNHGTKSGRNCWDLEEKLIFLVTQTGNSDQNLAGQIQHYGYHVQIGQDFNKLDEMISNPCFACIIVDLTQGDLDNLDWNTYKNVSREQPGPIPLIFVSDIDSQALRLQALQAGGVGFPFPGP